MVTRKRKPLLDLTNAYNLIPTSTLRKLVSTSYNSNSIFKPPISILSSNSSSGNQKLCSDTSFSLNRSDARSDTSIGSSSINATRNSRTVRFQTPKCLITSTTSPSDGESKDVGLSRRQTTDKLKKERKAAAVTVISIPVDKRKDKGKAIAVPFSCLTPEKPKDTENMICKPCCSFDKTNEKDLGIRSLLSGSLEKMKEFGKGILNPSSCSHEKTEDGKTILNYSGCSMEKPEELEKGIHNSSSFLVGKIKEKGKSLNSFGYSHDKIREKGKAIIYPPNIADITKHKGSSAAVAVNCPLPKRKSERRQKDAGASSCPPLLRTKNIQNDLDEAGDFKSSKSWTVPHPTFKKKRCPRPKNAGECCLPLDFVEQQKAYFREVDEFELPEEEISQDELD